ncbi:MAG: DUF4199 domain-containing protein [Phycisphaeraceae bacterium]|nr:DUF4199 domain-containing protein [Phycisphaeraceae bacterium]
MTRLIITWGLIIGLANLLWLYLSYYLGLHTSGVVLFQIVPIVWLVITTAGMIAALRSIRRAQPDLTYSRGLLAGLLISLITAAIAVLMQVGYYTLIHPKWPEYMVEQTRRHFADLGKSQAEIDQAVETARSTFTLPVYAAQSAISALVVGALITAIAMVFLRARRTTAP